jgi:hypothetical protein
MGSSNQVLPLSSSSRLNVKAMHLLLPLRSPLFYFRIP